MNENLPEDAVMLMSMVNMKLRDQYASLDELCEDMHIDRSWLEEKLRLLDLNTPKSKTNFGKPNITT